MKESSTYQAILEEGRAEGLIKGEARGALVEARKLLRIFGDRAFGAPDAQTAAAIERIDDLARLEALCNQLPSARSWQELLGQPSTRRSRKRSP